MTTTMTRTLLALALAAPLAAVAAPLTLDDALALASRQSHELVIAKADADLAGADQLGSLQGVLPRLDLSASGGRQYFGASSVSRVDPTTGFVIPPAEASDYGAYTFGLSLTQPIFDWAAFKRLSSTRASARAATRTYDESRLTVAFEVTRRFYEQVRAERTLRVLEKAASRSAELVERADALFAAGRAQKLDTFTARVNLGNDRIAVEQGRTRLVQARRDLALVLGLPGSDALEVVAPAALEAPGTPGGEPPPVEALMSLARERRPSLAAAAAQVEAADASLGVSRGGWWPTLAAQASYSRSGYNATGTGGVVGDPTKDYAAAFGLVLSWNLFAGRSTEASVVRAEAGLSRARATAAKAVDDVAGQVSGARQAVTAQARQVALSTDNFAAAEQSLALARQRLEAGLASQLEVRDASLKFTQAELSLVQARIDHAVATADLARAVGGAL
jgi:outer membrane protein TolC